MNNGFTRRQLAGVVASAALAAPAIAQPKLGGKLTFWGGLIFSDQANTLLTDTINAWGRKNGVRTEVVMINQNETVQKVSAAIASNTMPDALDLNIDLLLPLSVQGVFLPLDDVYQKIGAAHGGWFAGVDRGTDTRTVAGGRTGVPFGVSGNLLLRRRDLLEPAGFPEPPKTWDDLQRQAEAVNGHGVYGLGLALSNVGDGNTQVDVLQAFGGRVADDAGRRVTIKSEETRSYLRWLKSAWDKKLFPPGVTTWDGAGDNNAFLSGQAAFIANTGSVGIGARHQDPDLYKGSAFSPLPGGPKGIISPINPQLRSIPKTSGNVDAAKALIEHLADPEFMNEYFKVAIYGPVLQAQRRLPAFTSDDPILRALLGLSETGTAPGFPDAYNPAFAEFMNNYIVPKMCQRVVSDNWDFDRAMDEAQTQGERIYDKYK